MSQQPLFVCNASPLIAYERLERLDLLQSLAKPLYIPVAVRQEVFGARDVPDWIMVRSITQPYSSVALSPRLGAGESEAIVLALEMSPCTLIVDDLAARRAAQAIKIPVVGTIGLLITARQKGLVSTIKPFLDELIKADFRISDEIYHRALRLVGEI